MGLPLTEELEDEELKDEELLLLETMTYFGKDVTNIISEHKVAWGDDFNSGKKIGDIIKAYDLEKLDNDEEIGNTHMTGREWKKLLENIRDNDRLSELKMTSNRLPDSEGNQLAYVYEDPRDNHPAIVTFKGTTGAREWMDDVTAAGISDSPCQIEALDFIDGLPYNNVIVTGHSKGGNKAQYVAILSDKVVRAVSFDGEGMSVMFLEKYAAEIKANTGKITCYAYTEDFVHELGFEIPDVTYHYLEGHEPASVALKHGAYSMFVINEDGSLCFVIAEPDKESEYVGKIRSLANYLINQTQSLEDWDDLESLTGKIVSMFLSGNYESDNDKYKAIIEELLDEKNRDAAGKLVAYLLIYVKDNKIEEDRINKFFSEYLNLDKDKIPASTIMLLVNNLTDGGWDPLIKYFPGKGLKSQVKEFLVSIGFSEDEAKKYTEKVLELYDSVEKQYGILKTAGVNGTEKCGQPMLAGYTAKVRDFSQAALDQLLNVISEVEGVQFESLLAWNAFVGESWYETIQAPGVKEQAQRYYRKLSSASEISKRCVQNVFDSANAEDKNYAVKIRGFTENLNWIALEVGNVAKTLNPKGV